MAHNVSKEMSSVSLFARVRDAAVTLADRVRREAVRKSEVDQIIAQLNSMSDRELDDIGVKRGDIPELARKSV